MKHVKLNTGIPFDIEKFEDKTNKSFPFRRLFVFFPFENMTSVILFLLQTLGEALTKNCYI